ncbi:hypothetical protein K449DRAFT_388024 [Hypoxylon sp. EC38]|nr:hypothetical protein K449DRAFT_388024 [Hypoxylon sp. EC38]
MSPVGHSPFDFTVIVRVHGNKWMEDLLQIRMSSKDLLSLVVDAMWQVSIYIDSISLREPD